MMRDCTYCGHNLELHEVKDAKLVCSFHDNEGPCLCNVSEEKETLRWMVSDD